MKRYADRLGRSNCFPVLDWSLRCLLFAFFVATCSVIHANEDYPLEAADTSSPRATLKSFLGSMHEAYLMIDNKGRAHETEAMRRAVVNRVFRCLDQSELASAVKTSKAREASVCLKEVLDRIELPPESEWPGTEEVNENDLQKWTIPHTDISIIKIKDGPRQGEFLFSSDTVSRASDFYEIVADREYIERPTTTRRFYELFISEPGWMIPTTWIPEWSRARWFGQAIWQWIGLCLVMIVALVAMATIYLFGRWRAKKMRSNAARYIVTLAFPVAAMLIPLATRYIVVEQLAIYGQLVVVVSFILQLIFLFALVVVVISVANRLAELVIATPWVQPTGLDAQLVRLTCRLLGLVGAAVVLLEGGQSLGVPLTTLLAGASVSGLALALAAQDSLKNILGGMMIMLDKPFRVGERIVARGYDGTVEDIGLRSTKLRLLSGHQVSIPNEEMARAEIENVGRRPYIRQTSTIQLPSYSTPQKVKAALAILREILNDHEGMMESHPPRIFLRDVTEGALAIVIYFWYHPANYWDFLAFNERVTLQMAERFEAEGILYAAPALTVKTLPDSSNIED